MLALWAKVRKLVSWTKLTASYGTIVLYSYNAYKDLGGSDL